MDTSVTSQDLAKASDSASPSSGVTYVVFIGSEPGLYSSWEEAKEKVGHDICQPYTCICNISKKETARQFFGENGEGEGNVLQCFDSGVRYEWKIYE